MQARNIVRICLLFCLGYLPFASQPSHAQDARPNPRPTLGILEIQPTPAVVKVAEQRGSTALSLQRVTQSMDGQLLDRLFQIRRFDLVARRDMEALLKDVDLQQAFARNPVAAFKMAGCDYGLIVTLDDFDDTIETRQGEGGQIVMRRRTVRLSAVARIYDIERGVLIASANIQVGPETSSARVTPGVPGNPGDQFGELLVQVSREFASQAAMAVLDSTLPARIVSVRDQQVAINRGVGTGVESGQEWVIYAIGEVIVDPDTGEVLGSEEIEIGRIKIDRVEERLSWGRAIEDRGISVNSIARRTHP